MVNNTIVSSSKGMRIVTKSPAPDGWNPLCVKCRRSCRQPVEIVLVDCPRFLPYPFKVVKHRFDQLDLFSEKS